MGHSSSSEWAQADECQLDEYVRTIIIIIKITIIVAVIIHIPIHQVAGIGGKRHISPICGDNGFITGWEGTPWDRHKK